MIETTIFQCRKHQGLEVVAFELEHMRDHLEPDEVSRLIAMTRLIWRLSADHDCGSYIVCLA